MSLSIFFWIALPIARATGFNLDLLYGEQPDFWDEVDALENSEAPDEQLLRLLDKKDYGATEGIAKVRLEVLSTQREYLNGAFDASSLGIGGEGLVGGEAYNRISPRIHGYALWDVSFFGTLSRTAPKLGESGWLWLLSSEVGIGEQKIVQGEAIDFADDDPPISNSAIFFFAFDLGIGYHSQFSEQMRIKYQALFLPTLFHSTSKDASSTYGTTKGSSRLRWRTEFEQTFALQPIHEGGAEIGVQIFGGQQPTPVRILPRVWDSVHRLEFTPDLGSLIGIGPVIRAYTASREYDFEVYFGQYGGYKGVGASANISFLRLEAGTFGFEQSSQYRLRESRVRYASLGFHHAW